MKPPLLVQMMMMLALTVGSCEEPFTPKAPFESRPIVTCIVSGSASYLPTFTAIGTVGLTYDVSGLDPLTNTKDPSDTSAIVVLTIDKIPYALNFLKWKRTDTSRYTTPQYVFTRSGQLTYFEQKKLFLNITTSDGRHLSASTTVPPMRTIETDYRFVAGVTAVTVQPTWTFNWDNEQRDDHLYFPRLRLWYQIYTGTWFVDKLVEIPLTYVEKDGRQIPVYPTFTRNFHITYDFAAMTRAIAGISEGDTAKSRYRLRGLTFVLVEYDLHLSNYYASSHGYLDEYSIRVDETTYSNINGGIGVFGSYLNNYLDFYMKTQYTRSFGYRD